MNYLGTILLSLVAGIAASSLFAEAVVVDARQHTISFEAVSTDCGLDMPLEFLLVGPNSDRDYESMFVTVPTVREIAVAMEAAGIQRGVAYDAATCRFWPVGNAVTIEPSLWELIRDTRDEPRAPVVYTGGTRGGDGIPDAATNMPAAVFAFYDLGQSLFLFNDSMPQSRVYGRFQPKVKIPKGEKRRFTIRWNGTNTFERIELKIEPGNLKTVLMTLKERSATKELDVLVSFAGELTVAEAVPAAQALALIDSLRVKLNGHPREGLFYRAFLPKAEWLDRRQRMMQPYELRLGGEHPELTAIDEDWSIPDATDPKLTERKLTFNDFDAEAMTDTVFFYAPKTMKLAELYRYLGRFPARVRNYYVFPLD